MLIGYGEGCEKDLESEGDALGEHAEDSQAECYVSGHGYGQAAAHDTKHVRIADG